MGDPATMASEFFAMQTSKDCCEQLGKRAYLCFAAALASASVHRILSAACGSAPSAAC